METSPKTSLEMQNKWSAPNMNDEELDELLSCLVFRMGDCNGQKFLHGKISPQEKPLKQNSQIDDEAGLTGLEDNQSEHAKTDKQNTMFWSLYQTPARSTRKSCVKTRSVTLQNSESPTQMSKTRSRTLSVRFDKVEVREYSVEAGDNPACTAGPALTLGWDYVTVLRRKVFDYEYERILVRREPKELLQSAKTREGILKECGFTHNQISSHVERIERDRIRRKETIQNMKKYGRFDEKVENARAKVLKFLHLQKNDEAMMQELWFDAAADYCDELVGFSRAKSGRSRSLRRISMINPVA